MKFKAFTLVEALVVMIITGVLIGITVNVYFLFSKLWISTQNNNAKLIQATELEYALKHDIFYANEIYLIDNKLKLKNVIQNEVTYKFYSQKYIIREINSKKDTFFVTPGSLQVSTIRQLVDTVRFSISVDSIEKNLSFFKNYDATRKMDTLDINLLSDQN